MGEHSKLPPSSAARRVACPGSRALEAKYPPGVMSPSAMEGEAAHWVASTMLNRKQPGMYDSPDFYFFAPNGEPITPEMVEGAQLYTDNILENVPRGLNAPLIHIEERIDISTIHPDCWGTPDCWSFYNGKLFIWDYKFGHTPVEVFENWQLIEYAAGILNSIGITGSDDQYITVKFCIVQPRSFHKDGPIRTWEIKASQLRGYFNTLRTKESEAAQEIADCTPSPECAFCRGRHACQALQRAALSVTDITTTNTPWDLSSDATGNELRYLQRAAQLLDARITGLSEQASSMIKRGDRVPFFKLESSLGRERWKVDAAEVVTLGELFGLNLAKAPDVITPKQAVKLGLPAALIDSYAERNNGALKLVADDGIEARKVFGSKK